MRRQLKRESTWPSRTPLARLVDLAMVDRSSPPLRPVPETIGAAEHVSDTERKSGRAASARPERAEYSSAEAAQVAAIRQRWFPPLLRIA